MDSVLFFFTAYPQVVSTACCICLYTFSFVFYFLSFLIISFHFGQTRKGIQVSGKVFLIFFSFVFFFFAVLILLLSQFGGRRLKSGNFYMSIFYVPFYFFCRLLPFYNFCKDIEKIAERKYQKKAKFKKKRQTRLVPKYWGKLYKKSAA